MSTANKNFRQTITEGLPLFLIGILLITLTDTIGSILSRQLDFNYSNLLPISYAVYILIPFFIAKKTNKRTGVVFGSLLGLFDATVGWWISMVLKAKVDLNEEVTTGMWVGVAIYMLIFGGLMGLMGSLATMFLKKKEVNP